MSPALDSSFPTPAARPRLPRVMIIDDEPDTVMALLALLDMEGFDTKGFGSAREALKQLVEFDPDAVICDVAMPVMNGWDLTREVRRIMGGERPTLIAITGHYKKLPDELLARVVGFNHYVIKPWDPQALLGLLAPLK